MYKILLIPPIAILLALSCSPDKDNVENLEKKLKQEQSKSERYFLYLIVSSTGALLFLAGTAIGSKARENSEEDK